VKNEKIKLFNAGSHNGYAASTENSLNFKFRLPMFT
jgi:hypothetical protein